MKKFDIAFDESMRNCPQYQDDFANLAEREKWKILRKLYEKNYISRQKIRSGNIPKIIHQIWFGGDIPEKYAKLQESWKKYNPDWEYILWTDESIKDIKLLNEDIFNSTQNYGAKSDIARYEILFQFGGLYIDTDFECLQSFDLLNSICDFYAGLFSSKETTINNALLAATPKHPIFKNCLNSIKSVGDSNHSDLIFHSTGPQFMTDVFYKHYKTDEKINIIFPISFFYPFPNTLRHITNQKKIQKYIKKESYAIHYWDVSWQPPPKIIIRIYNFIMKIFPYNVRLKISKIIIKIIK